MSGNIKDKSVWTIGHSTRSLEEFLEILKCYHIEVLVDIRRFPGSRKYPHFNQETLQNSLSENGIAYQHLDKLGGRRKVSPHSTNTVWRNASFQGYADYMETTEFKSGLDELLQIAEKHRTAYMCSEAVWWRCHRSLVSDILKFKGWQVMHIIGMEKASEHPYTGPARVSKNGLSYSAE